MSVSQTPDVWYNEVDGSDGDLVLDIDLFGWECQPSTIKLESSVLDGINEFDAEVYGMPLGDHTSTYYVEAEAKTLNSVEDHYVWVIAEYDGLDYSNGLPDIPHADGSLAAFFRYPVYVSAGPSIVEPTVLSIDPVWGEVDTVLSPVTITGEFFEPTCTVMLEYAPGDTISGENLIWLNSENIQVDFNLTGATIGDYDVIVTNPGDLSGTLEDGFSVHHPPVVTDIDPNGGSTLDILSVSVTGDYFQDGCEVELQESGGPAVIQASGETWIDANEVTCTVDLTSAPLGPYDVVVINPDTLEGRLDEGFLVQNIVYVDDSNTSGTEDGTMDYPYNTIQEALGAVSAYWEVWVDDSDLTYAGPITLISDVALRSVNWDDSDGDDQATILYDSSSHAVNGANDATIDGFEIDAGRCAIYCDGTSPEILNILVNNCHNTSAIAVWLNNGSHAHLDNVEIYDTNNAGGNYSTFYGMLIQNCDAVGDDRVVIEHTNLHYVYSSGLLGGSYCAVYGMYITGSDGVLVKNTIVNDVSGGNYNNSYGVRINDSHDVEFVNVVIHDVIKTHYYGTAYGMNISNSNNLDVRNTIITHIRGDGYFTSGYGMTAGGSTVTLEYSDIWDCTNGSYSGVTPGSGYFSQNPLYVNAGTDFHLASGSPCINTGDPSIDDWDGSQSDMGAYGGPGGDW